MSPTSSLILGSSVQGIFAATINPCDQIGTHDPVAALIIEYVRVLARFSSFWAICSSYTKPKAKSKRHQRFKNEMVY